MSHSAGFSREECHRNKRSYSCKCTHQNRTKSVSCRFYTGIEKFISTLSQKVCVVYKNDTVVYDCSYKNEHTDYSNYIHHFSCHEVNHNYTDKTERHCKQNDERIFERFKLTCHYGKYKKNSHQNDYDKVHNRFHHICHRTFIRNKNIFILNDIFVYNFLDCVLNICKCNSVFWFNRNPYSSSLIFTLDFNRCKSFFIAREACKRNSLSH